MFARSKQASGQSATQLNKQERLLMAIILTDQEVQAALVAADQKILESSSIKTYFDRQDLSTQLDQAIQDLGPAADEVADCVFVFADDWLKDGDLLPNKKAIVQELSDDLSLSALGQLSINEAIYQARLMHDPHDSSLFLYFTEHDFVLLLIKHGQLLSQLKVGRSGKTTADLQEGLARISQELGEQGKYFPNKVYLSSLALSEKLLQKEQENLQAFDWTKVPSFLQVPEFMVLADDYLIQTAAGVAAKVLNKTDLSVSEPEVLKNQESLTAKSPTDSATPLVSSFGINLNQSVAGSDSLKAVEEENLLVKPAKSARLAEINPLEPGSTKSNHQANKKRSPLARFILKNRRALLLGAGGGLVALIVLISVFALFLSKVTIKIQPAQKLLQKSLTVKLDPNLEESDFANYLLKADLVNKKISGEDVANTTGVKLVGEKAKGKVNVFNKTDEEKTLAAGTLFSAGEINFVLDEEISVPAATEEEGGGGVDYGSQEVTLTAQDIGAEANLEKGSKLRVADYYDDTFSATVLENFSGGSSREVRVVSKEDMNLLAGQLREKLAKEAESEFERDSTNGLYFVATGKNQTLDFNYDQEEAAEAETLSLTMDLEFEAIKYASSDLKQFAQAVLTRDLPDNYVFIDEEPSLMSDAPTRSASDASTLTLAAELSARAQAKIDQAELIQQLAGQSQTQAQAILENNELIKSASIIYQPNFLANILKNLPKKSTRLQLLVE